MGASSPTCPSWTGSLARLKPYQNFHESQKFGPRKFLKLAQCLPKPPGFFGYLAASPDRARDGGGTCEEPVVHLEGVRPPVVQQLSLNDHDQHDQHDRVGGASAFLHGLSTASRAAPRRLAVPASFAFSRLTCCILV